MNFSEEEIKKHTPMMQSYLKIKKDYKDKLVFYRLGDFYELFFQDAIDASKILGITLTRRGNNESGSIPMAGVPFHAVDGYIQKAVANNRSIVICEQVGEQIAGKGIMERKVSKIVTPGTVIDNGILADKDVKILACIYQKGKNTDISWINFASGDIWCNRVNNSNLYSELMRIQPAEIIVAENQINSFVIPEQVAVSLVADWEFEQTLAENTMKKLFGEQYIHRFGLPTNLATAPTISCMINYLKSTQCIEIHHIQNIKWYKSDEFLLLDSNTKKHLEIISSNFASPNTFSDNTLWNTLDKCSTSMGSRLLKDWLNYPIRNRDVLKSRLDRVEFLMSENAPYKSWEGFANDWCDIERIGTRISLKTVRPRELAALRDTFQSMPKLVAWGEKLPPYLQGFLTHAYPNEGILKILSKYLMIEPSAWVRDGGVIANGVDSELDSCRDMQKGHNEFLKDFEAAEKIKTGIANLKVEFNNAQGFYISITRMHSEKVPTHYKRKQTLKNAERFTTAELIEYEQKALSAKDRALSREKILYDELLNKLQSYVSVLQKQAKILSEWDILNAFARMADERKYSRPVFNDKNILEIKEGRHPVIEVSLKKVFVPNDIVMSQEENLALITGPNMGGKSTVMRQLALITIMAHMGSFVPAKYFNCPEIDAIYTRIGANDDISNGRSTFMVEMSESSYILNNATNKSLVLLDELGRGTATYDGLSLAWSIASYLGNNIKAYTLFATHYLEMTELPELYSNVKNYHVSAIDQGNSLVFTYLLEKGPASRSYGVHVAELAGVNPEVINNAKEKLQELENAHHVQGSNVKSNKGISLEKELLSLDLNQLTPMQALVWINNKKQKLKDSNNED